MSMEQYCRALAAALRASSLGGSVGPFGKDSASQKRKEKQGSDALGGKREGAGRGERLKKDMLKRIKQYGGGGRSRALPHPKQKAHPPMVRRKETLSTRESQPCSKEEGV